MAIPYRFSSMKYRYSLDPCCNLDDDFIINDGLVANAFLNRFPQVVTNLSSSRTVHSPLVDKALECGFSCLILLPVFSASSSFSSSSSSCVGVVECCMKPVGCVTKFGCLVPVLLGLKKALQEAGLVTYHLKQSLPFQIRLFAGYHLQEALSIVCESHHLSLGQVWVPVPSDSSFILRLCGHCIDSDEFEYLTEIREYYDTCGVIPLKMGEGLPGKTLETRQHVFAKDSDLIEFTKGGLLPVISCTTDSSYLVICMTCGGVDYAFEFLWPRPRNRLIILEAILLTLERCLPSSFRLSCGARLGHQLRLLDLKTSTTAAADTTPSSFIVFQGKTTSADRVLKRKRIRLLDLTPPSTSSTADTTPSAAAAGPDCVLKRKSEFYSWWSGVDTILVNASSGPLQATFTLETPFTLADAKYKVERCFNYDPGTYTMEYNQFKDEKVLLNTDENFSKCIKLWKHKTGQQIPFKLCVIPPFYRAKIVTLS